MFDSIKCLYPLPLTHEYLKDFKIDWANTTFQTKNLDNSLSLYYIDKEGLLFEEVIEHEYVPYSEEEMKTIKPWNMYKDVIEKNKYTKQINYHGIINFYDILDYSKEENLWVEFNAYFVYGKVDKIDLAEAKLHKLREIR